VAIWRLCVAFWIRKATKTITEYAVAFPLGQWSHERTSVLRYTDIVCFVRRCRKIVKSDYWPRHVCISVRPHGILGSHLRDFHETLYIYRVSQEEETILRESVPYVKIYRYNQNHLYPKLNG
jgi:hypothetical protein